MQERIRHPRRIAGFTMVEALTVLVVIGVLTSFAMLIYGNYRRALRAKSSAKQIESLLTTARTLAINQNAHFQAVLDLNTSGLWIDQVDAAGQVVVPKVTTPENWSVYVRVVEAAVNGVAVQSNGLVRIKFYPNGTSDAARLLLLSEGSPGRPNDFYTLKIYPPTARCRIIAEARL